jgi:hypothetical protein
VMCLTLGLMPSGAVFVWRDVKHSTSAWRGGDKNTHDQSGEAEVTILMIYLLRWSFKVEDIVGCTHFLAEVEYAQLEVESPVMVRLWRTLGAMLYGEQGISS